MQAGILGLQGLFDDPLEKHQAIPFMLVILLRILGYRLSLHRQ